MQIKDARSLTKEAQEVLRKRVMQAVLEGRTHQEAAHLFGVARGTVTRWVGLYREQGEGGLDARPKGRPPHPALGEEEAALVVELVSRHSPDQLGLPFFLREAKEEGAEIHWGDEMVARSDHQAGTTRGRKGETPVVGVTGQRFRCNLISSLTNRGVLRFRVFEERFTSEVFIDFLRRLTRSIDRRVYLIVDRHPGHVSMAVAQWMEKHQDRIRLIHLPAYSPELNPGEYLNQDVKTNAVGRRRSHTKGQLMRNLRGYLRSTQRCPDVVRRFFHAEPVRYAAA